MCDKAQYVKRKSDEEYHEDCIVNTVKHPTKIMVWSVICGKGMGRLQIVKGIMNQVQYKKILEDRLIPQLNSWFPNGEFFHFMQDSAPCHTARTIKAFLSAKNIALLKWPGNSPDMNPIENVWELLKRKMNTEMITNRDDLIEKLIALWFHDEDLQQMSFNCIRSMPRRVKALIKAKGGRTKY